MANNRGYDPASGTPKNYEKPLTMNNSGTGTTPPTEDVFGGHVNPGRGSEPAKQMGVGAGVKPLHGTTVATE